MLTILDFAMHSSSFCLTGGEMGHRVSRINNQ
jgi:hypothetical protein